MPLKAFEIYDTCFDAAEVQILCGSPGIPEDLLLNPVARHSAKLDDLGLALCLEVGDAVRERVLRARLDVLVELVDRRRGGAQGVDDRAGAALAVAVVHDGDPYTEGLASVFRDAFTELGGEVVAFEAVTPDATDLTPVLTTIAAAGPPEFLYYPVFIELGANITKQSQEIDGLADTVLAAADGVQSPDFLAAAGDAAEGIYASGPDLGFGNDLYTTFLATYEEDYGTEPTAPFHAHAFDATNMVLAAIESVAVEGDDGSLMIGRQALRDALFATSGFAGVTGTLTCDDNGDCADPQIAVNEVKGGEFVPIWP